MANPRDVELVIRAKTEGEKALKALTGGLQDLVGIQDDLKKSANGVDTVLGRLGTEFASLAAEVQGLQQLGKVVDNLDRSAAALTRLEDRVAKTTDELGRLQAAQEASAAATLKAKASADAAAAAYQKQAAEAAAVRKEAGKSSEAYQQQATALAASKAARDQANAGLRTAQAEEKKVVSALSEVSGQLNAQSADLVKAHAEWEALYQVSQQASRAMGGVAASQDEVAAAAARAAEKLSLTKGAMDFNREAAAAKKLRDAAEYVDFWTNALREKEDVEKAVTAAEGEGIFGQSEEEAQRAADAMDSYQANLNKALGVQDKFTNSAKDSFATFAEAGRTEDQMAAATARLRAQIDPLGVIQANLNRELSKARELYRTGYISATELAKAEKQLAINADAAAQAIGRSNSRDGKGTFLGLRPYELHSLSFQINDVFTQLGSGTPVMQILAQQGGQVFQVFQRQLIPAIARLGPALAAASPFIAAAALALVALGAAVARLADMSARIKEFNATLLSSVDGARYSAEALAKLSRNLDEAGFEAKDATKAIKIFVKEGLDPEQLQIFAETAKNLAKVLGTDVATAAEKLNPLFRGSYEELAKLDDELKFLTPELRSYVRQQFEAGNAEKGRQVALEALTKSQKVGAEALKGPVTQAVKNLGDAWRNMLDSIGQSSVMQNTIREFSELAKIIRDITEMLPGVKVPGAAGNGGLPGGVTRRPDVNLIEGPGGGQPILSWTRPGWMGGSGGQVDVTADIAAIVRTVMKEAQAGDATGQQDVAAVILNRMAKTGKSAFDTVTAPNQFEPVGAPGSETRKTWEAISTSSQEFQTALENILPILEGKVADPTKGATLFVSPGGQAAKGRQMPAWADPSQMTLERGGHQFFTGAFPGSGGTSAPSNEDLKKGEDYIANLREQLKLTGEVADAERVRQAGLKALKDAQGADQNDATAKIAQELAEQNELAKIQRERADQARQLQSDLTSMTNSTAGAQDSLVAKFEAVNRQVDDYLAKLDKQERTALPGSTNFDYLRQQAEENRKILLQQAQMKWFEEQITSLTKQRADALAAVNSKLAADVARNPSNEAALREQALSDTKAIDAQLLPRISNIAEKAGEFAESIRTAEPNERLDTFIQKMKTLPTDLQNEVDKAEAASKTAILQQQRKTAEDPLNDMLERRLLLVQQIQLAQQTGQSGLASELQGQLTSLDDLLTQARDSAIEFWTALAGDPEKLAQLGLTAQQVQNIVVGLKNAEVASNSWGTKFLMTAEQINQSLADGLAGAFDRFAQAVANGENAFDSARDAFLQFASDFLRQIAQMILKQAILNALGSGKDGSGGLGNILSTAITSMFHEGGIAGHGGQPRVASPDWFRNARRMHTGGIVGLKPNEVPTILEENEEVLTTSDPRHAFNGGGAGGQVVVPAPNVKIINAIDAADMVSQGLNTTVGEKAILNLVRNNPGAFKQAMGV